jgi:hypothetical protein
VGILNKHNQSGVLSSIHGHSQEKCNINLFGKNVNFKQQNAVILGGNSWSLKKKNIVMNLTATVGIQSVFQSTFNEQKRGQ